MHDGSLNRLKYLFSGYVGTRAHIRHSGRLVLESPAVLSRPRSHASKSPIEVREKLLLKRFIEVTIKKFLQGDFEDFANANPSMFTFLLPLSLASDKNQIPITKQAWGKCTDLKDKLFNGANSSRVYEEVEHFLSAKKKIAKFPLRVANDDESSLSSSRSRRRNANLDHEEEKKKRIKMDMMTITASLILQDGPFFCLRMTLIFKYALGFSLVVRCTPRGIVLLGRA